MAKTPLLAYRRLLTLAVLSAAPLLQAANDTWTGLGADNNWQTAGNWLANATPTAGDALFFSGSAQVSANNNFSAGTSFGGLTFTANAGSFTLTGNSLATSAGVTNNSLNLETIDLPLAFAATHSLNTIPGGSLLMGGVISGAGGASVAGGGGVTFTANNTYTGTTAINGGTLTLDFTGGAANNIISSSSALSLGGGTLAINGSGSAASSQTFASTAISSGASIVSAAPAFGANNPTVALKAFTISPGSSVVFNGPATTNSLNDASVPATAVITTTTAGTATAGGGGLLTSANNNNPYATVGLYDWASTDTSGGAAGTSPYTIVGGSQVPGFYTAIGNNSNPGTSTASNLDFTTQQTLVPGGTAVVRFSSGTQIANTVRYNSGTAPYATVKSGDYVCLGGILVTPNMGSVNAGIDGLRLEGGTFQLVQNNTAAVFVLGMNAAGTGPFFSNANNVNEAVVKSGPGTWFLDPTSDNLPWNYINSSGTLTTENTTGYNYGNSASGTYGAFYFNGGVTVFNNPNVFGNPTAQVTTAGGGGTINLNGGTLMSHTVNVSLTYPNLSGTPNRYVFLGNNGGGLAAATGTALTVNGVVSGPGPLTIGIPASAANGYVAGLVPGTGGSTVNPALNAAGTVIFNGAGNTYSGLTTIAGGATLVINSEWALGGANYGGLAFNGGTLQYAGTLLNATTDVSLNPVTLAGNATIDVNGHAISLAGSIGNNGSGALTLYSSAAGGSVSLGGANTYSGGTTISNLTVLANNPTGSALGSGYVTVASGTLGGTGIINAQVEIQNAAVLSPGINGVGTNTVEYLQFDPGSVFNVGFSGASANAREVVTASGGLTINGGVVNLYQAGTTTAFSTPGTYNLIACNGGVNGGVGNWTVGNPQTGFNYVFGTSGSYVTLQISVASSVDIGTWGVDANGNWSAAANWTALVGTMPPHKAGDAATLGVGSAIRTITLDANETVGGVTMTNANSFIIASGGKTLTLDNNGNGAAINVTAGTANSVQTAVALNDNTTISVNTNDSLAISGAIANSSSPEALTLNVSGSLTLSGNNSYGTAGGTGTTLSGGGTVLAGNNNALGAGNLNVNGNNTIQAATATLNLPNNINVASGVTAVVNNGGNNLTLSGSLSSSDSTGTMDVNGNGTLTLTGNGSSFNGPMIVNQGVLSLPSSNPLNGGGSLILNGGDLLGTSTFSAGNNLGIGLASGNVGTNAQIDAASGQQVTLSGNITSAGNTGTNGLVVNSHTGDNGTVILGGVNTFTGTTVIQNGSLQLQNPAALENSTVSYNNQGGVLTFDPSIGSATLGALIGSQSLALTNLSGSGVALTVGGNGLHATYSGNLSDAGANSGSGSLTLAGGTLLLTGTSSFSGATTVSAGILTNSGVMDVLSIGVAAGGSAELVVAGGSLVATNSSNIGKGSGGLLVTGGSALFDGALTTTGNQDTPGLISVLGGSLTAASISLQRGNLTDTTQPTAGATTDGLYVDGGAVNVIGNLDMSSGSANSTVNARMDAGSLTVGGEVIIGLNNGGRWSVLDINGGTLTATNTTTAIAVAGGETGNGILLVRAGTANVGSIGLGNGANVDTAVVDVTGGALYLGAGGIVQVGTAVTNVIDFAGGIVGASTNWSCVLPITLAGSNATIQAADAAGNPQAIALSGGLSGTGNLVKSGAGVLTLSNTNTYLGSTTVSNGTLQLVAPANLDGTNFTSFTLATSNSILDLTSAGYYAADGVTLVANSTLYLTNASQTLTGVGAIHGGLVVSNGASVTVGLPTGALSVSQPVQLAGALSLNLNRPNASELVASLAVASTATLTVNNVGPALQAGDTFQLFSAGYSGHFSATNLPALSAGLGWTNTLAANGRLAVVQVESTTPTNVLFSLSGNQLSLKWPTDHTGWTLQEQTNNALTGLGTNWVDVAGSSASNSASITIDPSKPSVFFRLRF